MTNIFLFDYEYRLRSWAELRKNLKELDLAQRCIEIDRFWQRAPMIDHYLHPDLMDEWPTPWQLINDNMYCEYARALGMIYTFFLLDTKNIELVDAKDDNSNEIVLVLVDSAKYVMNYWPETVVNNSVADFEIIKRYDITPLYSKIG